MKIICCCITCMCGEEPQEDLEKESLISETEEPIKQAPKLEKLRSAASTTKLKPSIKRNEEEEAEQKKPHRGYGLAKKYHVSLPIMASKHEDQKPKEENLAHPSIDLKISIKLLPVSNLVKVFLLDATNVIPVLMAKISDTAAPAQDEPLTIQVRTKLIPLEIRSASKKYEIGEHITSAMKFNNECIQSMTMTEFQSQHLRFRLYNVFKQKRDIMLGEYILDLVHLGIEIESGTTNVVMQLHESNSLTIKRPEVGKRRTHGSTSGSATPSQSAAAKYSKGSEGHPLLRKRETAVLETPDEERSEEGKRMGTHSPSEKPGRSIKPGLTEQENKTPDAHSRPDSPFDQLRKAAAERNAKVSEAIVQSEVLEEEAHKFSELGRQLKEKYEKKHSGKR